MKTSRLYLWVVAIVLGGGILLSTSLATAPRTAESATRVGVCDVVQVFNNYERAKDLTTKLNENRETIKSQDATRIKSIEAVEMELEGLVVGSDEYEKRLSEVERLSIDRKVWLQYEEAVLMRNHHRLTKEMYRQILKMIAEVARGKGYHIVLYRISKELESEDTPQLLQQIERHRVLYAADSVDLSGEVLSRLNQAYGRKTGND